MRACRRASSITSTAPAPRSASSSCAMRARPARRSRDPSPSAARSWRKWRPADIRGPTSPRWAARIRPSSRRMPTSTARPRASRAPPTAWAGRSARRSRGSTCTRKWRTTLLAKIEKEIDKIRIGDPTERATVLGPVVNKRAHESYARYVSELKDRGAKFLRGGRQPSEGFARPRLLRGAGARGSASRPIRSGSTRCSCRS